MKNYKTNAEFVLGKFFIVSLTFLFALTVFPTFGAAEYDFTADQIIQIINHDRVSRGLRPLRNNPRLENAALAKARDMLRHDYFAHTSPLGTTPWSFIKAEDLNYQFAGENLAINYINPVELENDLLKSPSHRENLLSPVFSDVGIAVVQGEYLGQQAVLTVQHFASFGENLAQR